MRSAGNGFGGQPAEAAMSWLRLVARLKDQLDPPVLRTAGQGVVRSDKAAVAAGLDAECWCQPRVGAEQVVAKPPERGRGPAIR
jgi:hypothetical protein